MKVGNFEIRRTVNNMGDKFPTVDIDHRDGGAIDNLNETLSIEQVHTLISALQSAVNEATPEGDAVDAMCWLLHNAPPWVNHRVAELLKKYKAEEATAGDKS